MSMRRSKRNLRWKETRPFGFEFLESRLPFAADGLSFGIDRFEVDEIGFALDATETSMLTPSDISDFDGLYAQEAWVAEIAPSSVDGILSDSGAFLGCIVGEGMAAIGVETIFDVNSGAIPWSTAVSLDGAFEDVWLGDEQVVIGRSLPLEPLVQEGVGIGFLIQESSLTDVAEGDWIVSVEPINDTSSGIWMGVTQSGGVERVTTTLALPVAWDLGDLISSDFLARRGPHVEIPQASIEIIGWDPGSLAYAVGNAMTDVFTIVPAFIGDSTTVTPMAPSAFSVVSPAYSIGHLFQLENARGMAGEDFAPWNRLRLTHDQGDCLGMNPSQKAAHHAYGERYKTLAELHVPYPWQVEWQGNLTVQANEKSDPRSWRSKTILDRLVIASTDGDANRVISDLAMGMLPTGMLSIGSEQDRRFARSDRGLVPEFHFVAQATLICDNLNLSAKLQGALNSDEAQGAEEDDASRPPPDRSVGILLASCVVIGVQYRWRTAQSLVLRYKNGVRARLRRWFRNS